MAVQHPALLTCFPARGPGSSAAAAENIQMNNFLNKWFTNYPYHSKGVQLSRQFFAGVICPCRALAACVRT
eukprot:9269227-Pyramimonas_sp.AAC.1